jgi:hypothetical protein
VMWAVPCTRSQGVQPAEQRLNGLDRLRGCRRIVSGMNPIRPTANSLSLVNVTPRCRRQGIVSVEIDVPFASDCT